MIASITPFFYGNNWCTVRYPRSTHNYIPWTNHNSSFSSFSSSSHSYHPSLSPLILYLSPSLSFYFPPSPFTISFPPSLVPAIYVSKNTNTMPLFCQLCYSLLSLSKRWSIMWSKKLCRVSIFIIERYQKISTKSSLSNLQENLKKLNETYLKSKFYCNSISYWTSKLRSHVRYAHADGVFSLQSSVSFQV